MYCIAKEDHRQAGEMVSNRYTVKRFKTEDSRDKFLNKQFDNEWKTIDANLKSGRYFQRIDIDRDTKTIHVEWINLKHLQV